MTTSTEQNLPESLSNLSFILHYRKDCDDRERNLKIILDYLGKSFPHSQKIIINDNADDIEYMVEYMASVIPDIPNIKVLYMQNSDEFRKSTAFNSGAIYASGDVLCFWDVDVLIRDSFIKIAYDLIKDGAADHIYPFNGTFVDVQKDLFPDFLDQYNFDYIEKLWTNKHESLHFASGDSPGGCTMISKEAFNRMGGYDDRFIGWGFEDTDFLYRSRKVNKISNIKLDYAVCWHLHHENAKRLENPHYLNNLMIFNHNASR